MKKEDRNLIKNVIDRLGSIFIQINKDDEKTALSLVRCIKDLETLNQFVKENSVSPTSKEFADKHRKFCEEIGAKINKKDLSFLLMLSDNNGKNTITYAHMSDHVLASSISGAMMQSERIFSTVLKRIGMPQKCIECIDPRTNEKENIMLGAAVVGDMPDHLKQMLEKKLKNMMKKFNHDNPTDEQIKSKLESEFGGVAIRLPSGKNSIDFGLKLEKDDDEQ